MDRIQELVEGLGSKDTRHGCKCLKELQQESKNSNAVYLYFDTFAKMLESNNSYIRTRGILLIAANACWDTEGKIDKALPKYLEHIMDEKPITSRQCIKTLPTVARCKPYLKEEIIMALKEAKPKIYADSMSPLISKDIEMALKEISAG